MLIFSIALDPRHKFKSLAESISYDFVFSKLKNYAAKYCEDIMQVGTEKESSKAKQLMKEYIGSFHVESSAEKDDSGNLVSIEKSWLYYMNLLKDSPLRLIAERLFGIKTQAKYLESVWSCSKLVISPKLFRIFKSLVMKILNTKLLIVKDRAAHEEILKFEKESLDRKL